MILNPQQSKNCLIALNGDIRDIDRMKLLVKRINPSYVIAVDGGYDKLKTLGLKPNLLVGDLDSIVLKHDLVDIEIDKLPTEKDKTDFHYVLNTLVEKIGRAESELTIENIYVICFNGSRFDHVIANYMMLSNFPYEKIKLVDEYNVIEFMKGPRVYESTKIMKYLSIIPWTNEIQISMSGVKYPVSKEKVKRGSTKTLSNECLGYTVIHLDEGECFVMWSEDAEPDIKRSGFISMY